MLSLFNYWGCLGNGLILKQWIVKRLGGASIDRRITLAAKLYYRGKERAFIDTQGRDVATYMADVYANHHEFHSFREIAGWLKEEGLEYRNSYPSLIFREYVEQMRIGTSQSWKSRIARAILRRIPYRRFLPGLARYSAMSRAGVSLFTFATGFPGLHLVAKKRGP